MKNSFDLDRFSVRLLIGFVTLIALTTLSAGGPAYWLTRTQLERQAWSQVQNAQIATQSLLQAEQSRLANQLVLFVERPTLQQLTRQQATDPLQLYSQNFQSQSGLGILSVCTADGELLANSGGLTGCPANEEQGFVLLDGRPALVIQQVIVDSSSDQPLGTAVAGIWLEAPFLQQLTAATGVQQSILQPDGVRLVTTFAEAGTMASGEETAVFSPENQQLITLEEDLTYFTTLLPLTNSAGETTLLSEVALQVNDLVDTERRAFLILALSTASVGLLGSLLSIWFVRQVNAPLQKLTAAAEKIGQGDLVAPIPLISTPAEVSTLATALHRSQASMLKALQERSEVGERLNALLQSIVEGVATFDSDGRITFWSAGAHQLLGWSPDEVQEAHVNDLFKLADNLQGQFLDHVPPNGQKIQIAVLARSGKPIILALTGAQLIPPGGDTPQVALVFRDVTEEEAARRLRSYFLANISHEFRTPLSTLNASIELLLDEAENFTSADMRQLLKPTHVSLLSLQTLIDNLLESSRIEAGQFRLRRRLFPIHDSIENALNIARPLLERRSQPFSLAEPAHLSLIEGDPARLAQALVNLIINASKYSPIGQPIELKLEQKEASLWVGVADHGPGIPAAERSNLFHSFVRLDSGDQEQYGVGLGLYVVKTVIEAHDGQVGVMDRPEGGSLFWFEIPLRQKEGE